MSRSGQRPQRTSTEYAATASLPGKRPQERFRDYECLCHFVLYGYVGGKKRGSSPTIQALARQRRLFSQPRCRRSSGIDWASSLARPGCHCRHRYDDVCVPRIRLRPGPCRTPCWFVRSSRPRLTTRNPSPLHTASAGHLTHAMHSHAPPPVIQARRWF